ncbi:DMT family transporter [Mucilaginibacter myungsuensis]|uniref:DMT family transporter n=1 Tax=Mucilaginibacter myungsuensis TaxID=649104 RepID=A0A929KZL2_9SPHI|nr:DMT family transporter [Mucilaginibacter myungsuensis]MBE9663460.1 DMT family transporter [Mucilaginibacter myungsuensis]MDN3600198.1 DMT family transporter [Mucilaginibacter myungsuensis]
MINPKLSLVIGIICIAFSPIFVKLAGADAVASAFYRILIAWVLLAPYCIIKQKLKIAPKDMWLALLAGVVFASDIAVWNTSILMISATVSTLLANLAPVWVGLMSFIFLRKRSGWLFWLGTFVAIGGMLVLVGFQDLINLKFNLGIVLAVTASLLYSIYIMLTKGLLQRVDTITFMFYNMLGSAIFLLAVGMVRGVEMIHFATNTWLNFIGMGAICQLLGWLTINYAIGKLQATKTSVALLSQTVFTAIFAAIMLNEKLAAKEVIGSVVVLAGIGVTFVKMKGAKTAS